MEDLLAREPFVIGLVVVAVVLAAVVIGLVVRRRQARGASRGRGDTHAEENGEHGFRAPESPRPQSPWNNYR